MASLSPSPASANKIPTLRLPASCNPPSETSPSKQAAWIIFGATGHIGRSLVRTALSHGDKVTAVGRTFEHSISQMQGWHERCLGMLCDVRVRETVDTVIKRSIEHWGQVDVIANCTGHGLIAAAEDQSPSDLQSQFSTNFLGTLHILQLSLPYFRTNKIPGRYLIFSSTAGSLGIPGMAPYCATKYAVEGLIESLLYEVNVWGIRATLVEPGHLRNDDADADGLGQADNVAAVVQKLPPSLQPPPPPPPPSSTNSQHQHQAQQPNYQTGKLYGHFSVKPISPDSAYASPHSPAMHAKRTFQWLETRQPTSAVRAAELVWQLAHCSYPPLRLLLGHFAVESVRDRLRSVIEEIEEWKDLSFGERGSESGRKWSGGDVKVEGSGEGDEDDDGDDDDEQDDEHDDDDDGGGEGQGYGDEMHVDSNEREAV